MYILLDIQSSFFNSKIKFIIYRLKVKLQYQLLSCVYFEITNLRIFVGVNFNIHPNKMIFTNKSFEYISNSEIGGSIIPYLRLL